MFGLIIALGRPFSFLLLLCCRLLLGDDDSAVDVVVVVVVVVVLVVFVAAAESVDDVDSGVGFAVDDEEDTSELGVSFRLLADCCWIDFTAEGGVIS